MRRRDFIVLARITAIAAACLSIAACATPERVLDRTAATGSVRGAAGKAASLTGAALSRAGNGIDQTVDDALAKLEKPEDALVADPFEPFNRSMYAFNTELDRYVLAPVAKGYETAAPQFVRSRVRDFIDNWKAPVWLANDLMQANVPNARVTASRFMINTTLGGLGVYDFAAAHAELPKNDEDFGQTLAVWGAGNGAYLMLPLLGPTTFRDLTGTVVDAAIDPITWARFDGDTAYRLSNRTIDVIDIRIQTDPAIRAINESVDPYAQARSVYIQNRTRRVANGEDSYDDLPDFD
jgi:phospholipid-binding lipoprotein MlaA